MALENAPGGREPAPGRLLLVQQFVNSHIIEWETDDWPTPEQLAGWLAAHRLLAPGTTVSAEELARAREVRAALRVLLRANNGELLDPRAVAVLTEAARDAGLFVRFGGDGRARMDTQASGVLGALGRLIGIVYDAMADGTWERLKACRREICQWVFYDKSRNRSSVWCAMVVCGNRSKSVAYYHRRKPGS